METALKLANRLSPLGFTSVMIDGSLHEGSKTPTTFSESVDLTKELVNYAHKYGITVLLNKWKKGSHHDKAYIVDF